MFPPYMKIVVYTKHTFEKRAFSKSNFSAGTFWNLFNLSVNYWSKYTVGKIASNKIFCQ